MKNVICAIVLSVVFNCAERGIVTAGPPAVHNFFSDGERSAVKQGKILTRVYLKGSGVDGGKKPAQSFAVPVTRYTSGITGWEMIAEEKAYIPSFPGKLPLYISLLAYSRYSGMKYYSVTDRTMQSFILSAYTVVSTGSEVAVRDSRPGAIAPSRTGYFRVRDNRLGWLTFRGELYHSDGVFIAKNYTMTPVTRYGVKVSAKGEYRMITFLFPEGSRGYYLYSVHALRIRSTVMLKSGFLSGESFANRIRACTVHTAKLFGVNWRGKIVAAR